MQLRVAAAADRAREVPSAMARTQRHSRGDAGRPRLRRAARAAAARRHAGRPAARRAAARGGVRDVAARPCARRCAGWRATATSSATAAAGCARPRRASSRCASSTRCGSRWRSCARGGRRQAATAGASRRSSATGRRSTVAWHDTRALPRGPDFVYADEGFHRALAGASGNDVAESLLGDLNDRIRVLRIYDFTTDDRIGATIAEHLEIVRCVLARDADAAAAFMRAHVQRVGARRPRARRLGAGADVRAARRLTRARLHAQHSTSVRCRGSVGPSLLNCREDP